MSPIVSGIGWHMVGAASAASFYAPIGKVKTWSWETTWILAGIVSWLIMPTLVSLWLLPDYLQFYRSLDSAVLLPVVLYGAFWGIGGITYGLTLRYLGLSLGIGTAIGITLVVGTLLPPLVHGRLMAMVLSNGGPISLVGMVVALAGVATVNYAGRLKERIMGTKVEDFNLKKGLVMALLCGLTSSGMSFAIEASKPIEAMAASLGVSPLYTLLPAYVLIMGAGAMVSFVYCGFGLATKPDISLKKDLSQPAKSMLVNAFLASAGGVIWYFQFFFYAWGQANIPQHLGFVNWMLHMSGYVLFGAVVGLLLREWRGVGKKPLVILWLGMLIIILAANLVGIGMAS